MYQRTAYGAARGGAEVDDPQVLALVVDRRDCRAPVPKGRRGRGLDPGQGLVPARSPGDVAPLELPVAVLGAVGSTNAARPGSRRGDRAPVGSARKRRAVRSNARCGQTACDVPGSRRRSAARRPRRRRGTAGCSARRACCRPRSAAGRTPRAWSGSRSARWPPTTRRPVDAGGRARRRHGRGDPAPGLDGHLERQADDRRSARCAAPAAAAPAGSVAGRTSRSCSQRPPGIHLAPCGPRRTGLREVRPERRDAVHDRRGVLVRAGDVGGAERRARAGDAADRRPRGEVEFAEAGARARPRR